LIIRAPNNFAMDSMMRVHAAIGSLPKPEYALGYTFVDVDNKTYEQWNEPFFVPRNLVLEMICWAVTGNPRLVIVDLDLSNSLESMDPGAGGGSRPSGDQELAAYLNGDHDARCPHAEGVRTVQSAPIILVRRLQKLTEAATDCKVQRPSFIESTQRQSRANHVYWATSAFLTDFDGVTRNWLLWEQNCTKGLVPAVTPSIELFAAALLFGAQDNLSDWLTCNFMPTNCASCNKTGMTPRPSCKPALTIAPQNDKAAGLEIKVDEDPGALAQRIVYAIEWDPNQRIKPLINDQAPFEIFDYVPARDVIGEHPQRDSGYVNNRVVIIGESSEEMRDLYNTPLGEMPGALIILNSIHSLTQYKQLGPPNKFIEATLAAVGVIFIAALFASTRQLFATVASGLVMVVLSWFVSFELLKYSQWLNFALPLVVVWVHNLIESIREAVG
jgi:hypothetical protein